MDQEKMSLVVLKTAATVATAFALQRLEKAAAEDLPAQATAAVLLMEVGATLEPAASMVNVLTALKQERALAPVPTLHL